MQFQYCYRRNSHPKRVEDVTVPPILPLSSLLTCCVLVWIKFFTLQVLTTRVSCRSQTSVVTAHSESSSCCSSHIYTISRIIQTYEPPSHSCIINKSEITFLKSSLWSSPAYLLLNKFYHNTFNLTFPPEWPLVARSFAVN